VAYSSVVDTFYAQSSRRYVDFILLKPWYEFSYDQELTLLNNVKNKRKNTVELVREIERHMFYAAELSIKHVYAQAIEKATRAEFAAPDPYTTVIGDFSGVVLSDLTGGVLWENNSTLKIPRYFPFTQIYPKIAKKHPRIQKIAGNQNIVMEFQTADRLNMP